MQAVRRRRDRDARALAVFALLCRSRSRWWAARSLFGARAGWIAALLAALNPFLTYYAQETRMYSLSALLGLLVATTFLHAFVRPRPPLPAGLRRSR